MMRREFRGDGGVTARQLGSLVEHPILPEAEIDRLIQRSQEHNDIAARNRIITHYQSAVLKAAGRVRAKYPHVELAELMSEGTVGLVYAINKFDKSKGLKFINYVFGWMTYFMTEHAKKTRHTEHITEDGWRNRDWRTSVNTISIDEVLSENSEGRIKNYDRLGVFGVYTLAGENELPDLEEVIRRFGTGLDKRESEILRMSAREVSRENIGRHFGFSKERASQLYQRALGKIQKNVAAAEGAS